MSGKTPLILLPGLLCDGALWRHQAESLGDIADITVVDLTRDERLDVMARVILKGAPETFALAGLSMGGYLALEIMRQAPGRVERLALLDTSARPDTAEQAERRRGFIELTHKGEFKGVTERLLPLLIHPDRTGDRDLTGTVMGMAERVGKEAFIRQQHAIMARPDGRDALASITCPTLVLCGRQDGLTPLSVHEELARLIPAAALVIVEDCGHLPPLERPRTVSAVLRYWLRAS